MGYEKPKPSAFISLKWKILVLFTGVILVLNVAFTVLNHFNLTRQFKEQREAKYLRYSQEVRGLILQSQQHLQQMGEIIPSLGQMQKHLQAANTARTSHEFDLHWPSLDLNMGVDTVVFYDSAGAVLNTWGEELNETEKQQVIAMVKSVLRSEKPLSTLECYDRCMQYAVVPVLTGERSAGTFLLGASLTDLILKFKQVSGADMGLILAQDQDTMPELGHEHKLASWGVEVEALTQPDITMALLQQAAAEYPSLSMAEGGVRVSNGGQHYEVKLISLKDVAKQVASYLVVIDDVTQEVTKIETATKHGIVIGLISMVLSEGLVLFLVWTPASRLQQTVKMLPFLGQGAYDKVRNSVSKKHKPLVATDETHLLENATIALSYQLETLEVQVAERTNALADRMKELSRERDFVAGLLDTAQVIIITQSHEGTILMVNSYGIRHSRYFKSELVGAPFSMLISPRGQHSDMLERLQALATGRLDHLRQEHVMVCKDGTLRNISWVHSCLVTAPGSDQVILSVGVDVTERKLAEERVIYLSNHDTLTGLPNRILFLDRLSHALAQAHREKYKVAAMFLDLDRFKNINDSLGHPMGDLLLQQVAKRLLACVRNADTVARWGGDEFTIAFERVEKAEDVAHAAEGIIKAISEPFNLRGQEVFITGSIGISLYPDEAADMVTLMKNADTAVYHAKREGRSNYEFYSMEMNSRAFERLVLENGLRRAVERNEFHVHYQPQIDAKSKRVVGAEALVRWQHPEFGLVSPAEFIPIAEETGLIATIGEKVLMGACLQSMLWKADGMPNLHIAINISGRQFKHKNFAQQVARVLKETGVNPALVELELTESIAMENAEETVALMRQLKEVGVQLAIDDFGTGYSSMSYLKQFPIDKLKIDRSFIRDIGVNPDDATIARSIINLGHSLNLKVTAEGVETEEQLQQLVAYGCDEIQGYLYGHPMSSQAFAKYVKDYTIRV